jgi:hypothetical protein
MEWNFDRIVGVAGLVLGLIAILVGLGVALAMDPKTPGEHNFVRGCFAVSALLLLLSLGAWGVHTNVTLARRGFVVALACAVIGVSLTESIRWADHRSMESVVLSSQAASKDGLSESPSTVAHRNEKNEKAGGNSGSVTQTGSVNVNGVGGNVDIHVGQEPASKPRSSR